jgi:hypothetical protein
MLAFIESILFSFLKMEKVIYSIVIPVIPDLIESRLKSANYNKSEADTHDYVNHRHHGVDDGLSPCKHLRGVKGNFQ